MADRADQAGDDSAGPSRPATDETPGTEEQLRAWLVLGQQALATAEQLGKLVSLELGLALADGRRLLVVLLVMVPVLLLAWLGFSALLTWLVYLATQSVTIGIAGFLLLQLITLALLLRAARSFAESLRLPASRRQWQAMMNREQN